MIFFVDFFNTACIVEIKHYCTERGAFGVTFLFQVTVFRSVGFQKWALYAMSCVPSMREHGERLQAVKSDAWCLANPAQEQQDVFSDSSMTWAGAIYRSRLSSVSWLSETLRVCRMIKSFGLFLELGCFEVWGPAWSQPHQIACGKVSKVVCCCRHQTSGLTAAQGIRSEPPISCRGMHTR